MALLHRVVALLAAAEAAYGVPPAVGDFHGILCNAGSDVTPSGDKVERDLLRPTLSPLASRVGAKRVQIAATVEARGGGVGAGGLLLPPDYEPLLLACGVQRTDVVRLTVDAVAGFEIGEAVTGGTSAATGLLHHIEGTVLVLRASAGTFAAGEMVSGGDSTATATIAAEGVSTGIEYRPLTAGPDGQPSVAIRYHKSSILHIVNGCRGTAVLDCPVGKIPIWKFTLTGLWADPSAEQIPNPVLSSLVGPVFVNARAAIGDYSPVMSSFSLDLGATVTERQNINAAEGLMGQVITGRRPTGSLDPEVDDLAVYNPWTAWKNATPARLVATIGDTPGNRVHVEVPKAAYEDVKYGERSSLSVYQQTYLASVDRDGDDEWRITYF